MCTLGTFYIPYVNKTILVYNIGQIKSPPKKVHNGAMAAKVSAVLLPRRTYDLIVTFIRPDPNARIVGPSFLIQILKFGREARYCPFRGLVPQRPINGLSRRICKSGLRFAQSIVLGFLRHKRESLNSGGRKGRCSVPHLPRCIIQCYPHPAIP
jgi:hypothetical protein